MSNKYIERFDKYIKTFKNQEKRFDIVMYILIGGIGISLYPPPKSGDAKALIVMSNRII